MNRPTHPELVAALAKPGEDIISQLTPLKAHMWHMASCICGEAGELFDAIKKHVIYGKDLDIENVQEEYGDLEFYMEGLRQAMQDYYGNNPLLRALTLELNIEKLLKRYEGMKYTDKAAQERADKQSEHPSPYGTTIEDGEED